MNCILEDKALRKSGAGRDQIRHSLRLLKRWGGVLGLFHIDSQEFLLQLKEIRIRRRNIDPENIEARLAERLAARSAKDFARSDAIRNELLAQGVTIQDTPQGSTWDVE